MKPWTVGQVEVGGGVHRDDARHRHRVARVDRLDVRVRDRRAHERDVQQAGDREVVVVLRSCPSRIPGSSRRRTGLPRIEPDVGIAFLLRCENRPQTSGAAECRPCEPCATPTTASASSTCPRPTVRARACASRSAGICGSDLEMVRTGLAAGHARPRDRGRARRRHARSRCIRSCRAATCEQCRRGRPQLCRDATATMLGVFIDGGMADEIVVDRVVRRRRCPRGIGVDDASLVEPLAVALHACNRAGIDAGHAGRRRRRGNDRPAERRGRAPPRRRRRDRRAPRRATARRGSARARGRRAARLRRRDRSGGHVVRVRRRGAARAGGRARSRSCRRRGNRSRSRSSTRRCAR